MTRRLLPVLVTLLGVLPAIGPAAALSPAQTDVIENVAQVIAGTNVCTRLEPNLRILPLLSIRYGMRFDDPAVVTALEERTRFHAARIVGRGPDDICAALERLFGPDGSNVKNFVRPK